MPVDREDGRHWCAPDAAAVPDGEWTCPGCGKVWVYDTAAPLPLGVWRRSEEPSEGREG